MFLSRLIRNCRVSISVHWISEKHIERCKWENRQQQQQQQRIEPEINTIDVADERLAIVLSHELIQLKCSTRAAALQKYMFVVHFVFCMFCLAFHNWPIIQKCEMRTTKITMLQDSQTRQNFFLSFAVSCAIFTFTATRYILRSATSSLAFFFLLIDVAHALNHSITSHSHQMIGIGILSFWRINLTNEMPRSIEWLIYAEMLFKKKTVFQLTTVDRTLNER